MNLKAASLLKRLSFFVLRVKTSFMANSSFLIAITGGSGSGKSTLSVALSERLGSGASVLLNEDAYYWPMSHYGDFQTELQREKIIAEINYDDPSSKDADHLLRDLTALKNGKAIEQPIYDYSRHDRSSDTNTFHPAPILILEGIHALSIPAIESLIDLSVYVDTPDDLRLARRIRRDTSERGRSIESVLTQYLGTVRPAHYAFTHPAKFIADLVLADEGLPAYGKVRPTPEAIERMLAPVLERLRQRGLIKAEQ